MKLREEIFFDYPVFDTVKDVILYTLERYPNNKAFIVKEKNEDKVSYKDITYREFVNQVYFLATEFNHLGFRRKKIGIISKNRYEWVLAFVACFFSDVVVVPLDKGLTPEEIENSVFRAELDAIVFDEATKEVFDKIRKDGKSTIKEYISMDNNPNYTCFNDLLEEGKELFEKDDSIKDIEIDPYALSELVFTSGTSAESKVVMLSQFNLARNISDMHLVEDFRPTDVNLAFLPLHHTFGSTGELIMLSTGITTAFPDGLRYIKQNLKEYNVTFFVGVPLLVEAIYKNVEKEIAKQGKTKMVKFMRKFCKFLLIFNIDIRRKVFKQIIDELGGLRFVISGAAALDKEVEAGFNEMGILTVQGYGMTEASPVIAAENYKHRRYGSIGFQMPSVEIRIDDKGEDGIGELVVKAPNVMMGYYKDLEKTQEVLKHGWLHTGDLVYQDKDEFIYIVGRKKDMIVLKNGKKIFPDELELMINKLDLVKECMVFGLPKDDDVSLAVKVKYDDEVVSRNYKDLSEEELNKELWKQIKEINQRIPKYKYIKHLFVEKGEFIKTTTNKIKRQEEMKKIKKEKEVDKL